MTELDFAIDMVLKSWAIPIFPLNEFMVDTRATLLGDVGVVGVVGSFDDALKTRRTYKIYRIQKVLFPRGKIQKVRVA